MNIQILLGSTQTNSSEIEFIQKDKLHILDILKTNSSEDPNWKKVNGYKVSNDKLIIPSLNSGTSHYINIQLNSSSKNQETSSFFQPTNVTLFPKFLRNQEIEEDFSNFSQDTELSLNNLDENCSNSESSECNEYKSSDNSFKNKLVTYDVPIYTNKKVDAFIRLYTSRKRNAFKKGIKRSYKYLPMIYRIFKEHGVPQDLAYLAIVESNFNPRAVSRAKATGVWQFMYHTGKRYNLYRSWWHDDRMDPEKSTVAAAKYLKRLYKIHNSWELALAAYNSGSGRVRRAIRKNKKLGKPIDYWSLRLPRETRGYVPAYMAATIIYKNPEKYGFSPHKPLLEGPRYQDISVPGGVSLKEISELIQVPIEKLESLNPALKRGVTPASLNNYLLHIPTGIKITDATLLKINELRSNWEVHKVRRGDTLWTISRKYRVPIYQIKAFNKSITKRKHLRIGTNILLPIPEDYFKQTYSSNQFKGHFHKVKRGESLWTISQKYGVSLRSIFVSNEKLSPKKTLQIGTILKIPSRI